MKRISARVLLAMLIWLLVVSGCSSKPQKPEGVLSPDELLDNPVYNVQLRVYGKMSGLGDFECPCFFLRTDEINLNVTYDMMVDDDGTQRPAVSVDGLENGEWVIVTGELKDWGGLNPSKDFWASSVEVIP